MCKTVGAWLKTCRSFKALYAGPMAYNFIHGNIPVAIPSLRSIQRILQADYFMLSEGKFQFDELVNHLKSYTAPPLVVISEDATCIISRVEYCSKANTLVGFALPCDNDGLPIANSFLATSVEAIEELLKHKLYANMHMCMYMAQSISKMFLHFVLHAWEVLIALQLKMF